MSFAVRGVIESFYDRLWTPAERSRVAAFAARHGFNAYVYAPKEERTRNAGWRDGPPPAERAALRDLAEACHADGIQLWIGLRPLAVEVREDADLAAVAERIADDLAIGADRILLLADDLPGDAEPGARSAALADAHATLVLSTLERLALDPRRLAFCPTDYAGTGSPYLEVLGRRLPTEVDLCWTGRDVVVRTITVDEADAVAMAIARPPLVWDNYPVNDAGMVGQLHLGPLRGRDPDLGDHVRGLLVNAALQPEATLVPIATAGEYLSDPASYDPDAAFDRGLIEVAGDRGDAGAVAVLAAALDRSAMHQPWPKPPDDELEGAIRRLPRLRNRRLAEDLAGFVPGE